MSPGACQQHGTGELTSDLLPGTGQSPAGKLASLETCTSAGL